MSETNSQQQTSTAVNPSLWVWGLAIVLCVAMFITFWDGLVNMEQRWQSVEEYNHGYLIPVVAFYLLWLRVVAAGEQKFEGSWFGLVIILAGLFTATLGELSAIFTIVQYAFLISLTGIVIAIFGWRGFAIAWVPLAYLFFMIPLPQFLLTNLSNELQLISSILGVSVIRWFGVSVFLEGNVIDLGSYQLQVADACSGLRYLFPLMSFGFLCAAIFKGPFWQRAVIFLSSIPLTILMNSFRIGVIGVLVNAFGIEQAEGFLHFFEGWIIFMTCVGIMFLAIWIFARMKGEGFFDVFGLDVPPTETLTQLIPRGVNSQGFGSVALLLLGVAVAFGLQQRTELIPERASLQSFPYLIGEWRGRDTPVNPIQLESLKLDDYLHALYTNEDGGFAQIWIAWYDTQRKGQSTHSPRTCLPGGGWKVETFEQVTLPDVGPGGNGLPVNRVVIAKGDARQLVYYWFAQRGRTVTNEYLVKWYIFWDSLTKSRTDGALVRVITGVADPAKIGEAEEKLQQFVRDIDPSLNYYLPQESATVTERQLVSSP